MIRNFTTLLPLFASVTACLTIMTFNHVLSKFNFTKQTNKQIIPDLLWMVIARHLKLPLKVNLCSLVS